jgi:hypothetical protein
LVKTESQKKAPNTYTNFDTYQLLQHISKALVSPRKPISEKLASSVKPAISELTSCCVVILFCHISLPLMHQSSLFPISPEKGTKSQSFDFTDVNKVRLTVPNQNQI